MAFVLNYREFLGSRIFRQGGKAKSWRWRHGAETYVAAAKDSAGRSSLTAGLSARTAIGRLPLERQQQCALPSFIKSPAKKILRDQSVRQLIENRYSP